MAFSEQQQEATLSSSQARLLEIREEEECSYDTHVSKSLNRLETFLKIFGFCQNSIFTILLSWLSFLLVAVALPLFIFHYFYSSTPNMYEIKSFELEILAFQSLVAAFSLLCISHNLRKYGVRKFLFVDRSHGHCTQLDSEYAKKINDFFYLLAVWLLPCLLVKTAREGIRLLYLPQGPLWQSIAILIALTISWTYSSVIFLSGCTLFNLVCNFQVIRFDNYGKLLEKDLDVSEYIEEHIRLTHYMSKISHRFRIFFVFELLVVTASLFVALVETTGNHGLINLINGADFGVTAIVELVGLVICLHAATRVSHRAQGIVSVATRWHSMATCASNETSSSASQAPISGNGDCMEVSVPLSSDFFHHTYSESDLEAVDYVPIPTNTALSTYQKRQSFVMYLMANPGGFTVFGWRIDRALVNTIFFLEVSLAMFVLGKTITFPSQ
ncbi:unnamed protein product [Linum trigynum]|uniref:Odorant receptor n=1 Tax=Linum trigynum TaxID=586398 RepID=A0AAV2G530_9ROSI